MVEDQHAGRKLSFTSTRRNTLILAASTAISPILTTTSVAAQDQVKISLHDPDNHTSQGGSTQVPTVRTSGAITFDNGTNYEFVIEDTDTGGKITVIPPIQATTDSSIRLASLTGEGVRDEFNFWVFEVTDGPIDADAFSDGPVTTDSVANLRVSLKDASTGEIIDQTDTKPYVIGYEADYDQDSTNGLIEISANQSSLPADSSVTATVFSNDVNSPSDTADQVSLSLEHDESESAFKGTFDPSELAGGVYDIDIEAELPPRHGTEFSRIDRDVISVAEDDSEEEDEQEEDEEQEEEEEEEEQEEIEPPSAEFEYAPTNPEVGEQVAFDASDTVAPSGEIVAYEWEFGDGKTASGETVSHTFEESGGYTIELSVVDENDESDEISELLTVEGNGESTELSVPGFGAPSAIASLGGAGYLLKRRLADTETDSE